MHAQDYLEIRQLVEKYADAVNRVDAEAWGTTWAPDGVWDLRGNEIKGRDEIVAFWSKIMPTFGWVIQIVHSGALTSVSGDTATANWYIQEFIDRGTGEKSIGIGCYRDTYSRVDGEWRFARRRYDLLYTGAPDLSGTTSPHPDFVGIKS